MSSLPEVADPVTLLHIEWRNHWLTPREYARHVGRPVETVYTWIKTGRLAAFSVPYWRDSRGRVWIQNVL